VCLLLLLLLNEASCGHSWRSGRETGEAAAVESRHAFSKSQACIVTAFHHAQAHIMPHACSWSTNHPTCHKHVTCCFSVTFMKSCPAGSLLALTSITSEDCLATRCGVSSSRSSSNRHNFRVFFGYKLHSRASAAAAAATGGSCSSVLPVHSML
jgi:hypothetical protein